MGKGYLIDTNVVIGFLNNVLPVAGMKRVNEVVDDLPILSVISKIELLRFNTSKEAYKILVDFVDASTVVGLSDKIVDVTIEICKRDSIKLPDAIIAATAICSDLILLTRNTSDFKGVSELELLNPWSI